MFGTTADNQRIAAYLQEELPSRLIRNFAVSGYGLGQIVLSVERSLAELGAPDAFIGVLTSDLDRTVLSVRSGPKPWFEIENGALVENRDHLKDGPEEFFRNHPPRIASFVLARTWLTLRRQASVARGEEYSCRVEEKSEVAWLLIERLADVCEGQSCQVVLFQRDDELERDPGWREIVIKEACEAYGLPVVDTRESFLLVPPERRYQLDRHPTAEANWRIALQLQEALDAN